MTDARHDHDPVGDPDGELTVRGILYTAFGILAVTAVAMVLMWWLGASYRSGEEASQRPLTPLEERSREAVRSANEEADRQSPLPGLKPNLDLPVPPGPSLELVEGYDMERLRAEEDERLNHYGWLDEETGQVHIPVDRAIAIALERAAASAEEGSDATEEAVEGTSSESAPLPVDAPAAVAVDEGNHG